MASLKTQEAILEKRVAERTAELEEMARQDTLTGLLNRTGLADRAAAAWGRREKSRRTAGGADAGSRRLQADQ